MVGILDGSARDAAAAGGQREAAVPYFTTAHCYHPGIPVSHATPDESEAALQEALRLRPDDPSPSGAISRLVRGVTIHGSP